jgi:hypothetical protein
MIGLNSQSEKPEKERRYDPDLLKKGLRCDLDQYEMLKRCSDKKDMTEWNEWREKDIHAEIWLQEAPLEGAYLKEVWLFGAHLEGARLRCAHMERAQLENTHLEGADLFDTNLEGSDLRFASLGSANIEYACLEAADFTRSSLKGANLTLAILRGADFTASIVDGSTLLWDCFVDRKTDFRGVGLDNIQIDPGTKQLLEYNIRRMNWEEWYKKGGLWRNILKRIFVWPFWLISDYGRSTWRIIFTFFGLALFFAAIYFNMAFWFPPGIVSNLELEPHLPLWHYGVLAFIRPIYFSIVTMTTLGFGDMYANAQSIWGHILLTFQVILGYVLLGALVTRFAVLFTAGGPAGKFADEKEKTQKIENISE